MRSLFTSVISGIIFLSLVNTEACKISFGIVKSPNIIYKLSILVFIFGFGIYKLSFGGFKTFDSVNKFSNSIYKVSIGEFKLSIGDNRKSEFI